MCNNKCLLKSTVNDIIPLDLKENSKHLFYPFAQLPLLNENEKFSG